MNRFTQMGIGLRLSASAVFKNFQIELINTYSSEGSEMFLRE